MFRSLSRTWILVIAFVAGIVTAALLIFGIGFIVASTVTINDIEEKGFPVISDEYIGEYPEVYIRDMTLLEMIKE